MFKKIKAILIAAIIFSAGAWGMPTYQGIVIKAENSRVERLAQEKRLKKIKRDSDRWLPELVLVKVFDGFGRLLKTDQ